MKSLFFYLRNNFMAWVEVPEVKEVFVSILSKCKKERINTDDKRLLNWKI